MEITLSVIFNSLVKERFEIKNPPVLPNEGDTVSFKWEDYLNDQENIRKLREYELNSKFLRANIITKRYSKEGVEVVIFLFEESDYLKEEQQNKELSVYVVALPDALEVLAPYMKN
jgi:hypothetical protein